MQRLAALTLIGLAAILASGAAGQESKQMGARDSFPADVRAIRDVRVPAEVSGRVIRRPEDESAAVKAGEVVVTIDPTLLRAGARAGRAAARRSQARQEWAQLELKRVSSLFERGSVGEADLDRARVAAREAEAGLAAAEARAAQAEERLNRSRIVAPFDGKLVRVYPEAGEYLRTGETAFRLIDDSSLKIIVYLPARVLHQVRPGSRLRIEPDLDARKLPALDAKVFSVAAAAEGKARTFRVEARARDKSARWRPGMTGRVLLGG